MTNKFSTQSFVFLAPAGVPPKAASRCWYEAQFSRHAHQQPVCNTIVLLVSFTTIAVVVTTAHRPKGQTNNGVKNLIIADVSGVVKFTRNNIRVLKGRNSIQFKLPVVVGGTFLVRVSQGNYVESHTLIVNKN